MVDEVGIDHVLKIAALVVGKQHVDGLGGFIGAAFGGDGVVDGGDDGRNVREQTVGVDFAHRLLDGLGAEGASDLLESEELVTICVFDEVDIGKPALLERQVSIWC